MKKSLLTILSGLMIVLAIVLLSMYAPKWAQIGQTSVLGSGLEGAGIEASGITETPAPSANLKVVSNEEPFQLRYGSQSEVLHFGLVAEAPYSLRYMSVHFESQDLDERILKPNSWVLYAVEEGLWEKVGHGERIQNGTVLMRVEPEQGLPFFGTEGRQDFVITTTLLKAEGAASPSFKLTIPEIGWEWADGQVQSAWISYPNKKTGKDIQGLPGEMLENSPHL